MNNHHKPIGCREIINSDERCASFSWPTLGGLFSLKLPLGLINPPMKAYAHLGRKKKRRPASVCFGPLREQGEQQQHQPQEGWDCLMLDCRTASGVVRLGCRETSGGHPRGSETTIIPQSRGNTLKDIFIARRKGSDDPDEKMVDFQLETKNRGIRKRVLYFPIFKGRLQKNSVCFLHIILTNNQNFWRNKRNSSSKLILFA